MSTQIGQVVNVKEFGATGDGTTDDSAAIQLAIDAIEAMANPLLMFFPVGEYLCNTGLVFDDDSIRIEGGGGQSRSEVPPDGSTLIAGTNGMELLRINSTTTLIHEGPIIKHLNFRDESAANTATLLHIHNANRWTLRNCTFRNASAVGGIGVELTRETAGDNAWGIIDQCTFDDLDTGLLATRSFGLTMIGGHFTTSGAGWAVSLDDLTQHVKIFGTKFDNDGILCEGANCSFQGVSFEAANPGLRINDTGSGQRAQGNSIIGCVFAGTGSETGIDFAGTNPQDNQIAGVTFVNLGTEIVVGGVNNNIAATEGMNGAIQIFAGLNLDWRHSIVNADTTDPMVLPDAVLYSGKMYLIRRRGGNTITIDVSGSDTFDDGDTQKTLDTESAAIGVFSQGTSDWQIVDTKGTVGGS